VRAVDELEDLCAVVLVLGVCVCVCVRALVRARL
jgi:hypothetical protein